MTERFPPIHPGEILLEEFLEPMGISLYRLSRFDLPAALLRQPT